MGEVDHLPPSTRTRGSSFIKEVEVYTFKVEFTGDVGTYLDRRLLSRKETCGRPCEGLKTQSV